MELFVENVSKKFKDMTAVDDVSLRITPGVWGLLGANGAGKTTLMRMIAGIMEPSSGKIYYNGIPIKEFNRGSELYIGRLAVLQICEAVYEEQIALCRNMLLGSNASVFLCATADYISKFARGFSRMDYDVFVRKTKHQTESFFSHFYVFIPMDGLRRDIGA